MVTPRAHPRLELCRSPPIGSDTNSCLHCPAGNQRGSASVRHRTRLGAQKTTQGSLIELNCLNTTPAKGTPGARPSSPPGPGGSRPGPGTGLCVWGYLPRAHSSEPGRPNGHSGPRTRSSRPAQRGSPTAGPRGTAHARPQARWTVRPRARPRPTRSAVLCSAAQPGLAATAATPRSRPDPAAPPRHAPLTGHRDAPLSQGGRSTAHAPLPPDAPECGPRDTAQARRLQRSKRVRSGEAPPSAAMTEQWEGRSARRMRTARPPM